jgi:hypothetical protein
MARQKVNGSFNQPRKERDQMKKVFAVVLSGLTAVSLSATAGSADTSCAVEVGQAKAMLQQKQQLSRTDVSAPRSLAGARVQEAPRSQQEAPRTQDVQAPRSLAGARIQEAPRSQQEAPRSVQQAPRSQQEAPRSAQEAPRSAQEAPRSLVGQRGSSPGGGGRQSPWHHRKVTPIEAARLRLLTQRGARAG